MNPWKWNLELVTVSLNPELDLNLSQCVLRFKEKWEEIEEFINANDIPEVDTDPHTHAGADTGNVTCKTETQIQTQTQTRA